MKDWLETTWPGVDKGIDYKKLYGSGYTDVCTTAAIVIIQIYSSQYNNYPFLKLTVCSQLHNKIVIIITCVNPR